LTTYEPSAAEQLAAEQLAAEQLAAELPAPAQPAPEQPVPVSPSGPPSDVGLLSPTWAGSASDAATSDSAVLQAMLDVELALVQAELTVAGTPSAGDVAAIAAACRAELFDVRSIAVRAHQTGTPVIPLLTDLRDAVGPQRAGLLHRGATSQDVVDTALMLVAARAYDAIKPSLQAITAKLSRLADEHRRTLQVGRTLTQHAEPTTFGLQCAQWLTAVVEAHRELAALRRGLPAQLGGAVGTRASIAHGPRLYEAFAGQLGLATSPLPWHTRRRAVTAYADALTTVSDAVGTIAVDVALLSRPEIGEVSEEARSGRGASSAMPHKHNPVLSVLIHSAARRAPALAAELHRSAISLDARPDGAWHSEWPVFRELLRTVGGAAELSAELVTGLRVHPDRMCAQLAAAGPVLLGAHILAALTPVLGAETVRGLLARSADAGAALDQLLRTELESRLPDPAAQRALATLPTLLDPANHLGETDAFVTTALAAAGAPA
jgi:3-carboxy-cis,cis-muconate cycloisomerase